MHLKYQINADGSKVILTLHLSYDRHKKIRAEKTRLTKK